MKLKDTRYKGVWSAGYMEAMTQANKVLRRFVQDGGQFSSDAGRAWDMGSLALKLGDRIGEPPRDGIIIGMEILLRPEHACPQCLEIGASGDETAILRHHNEVHKVPLPPPTVVR